MTLTLYINSPGLEHEMGPAHPECPARLQTLISLFNEEPFAALPRKEARPATIEQIMRAHPQHYINAIRDAAPETGYICLDHGDTVLCPGTWDAAISAAGAVCQAVDDVAAGKTDQAFCAVRPPGHHAEIAKPMGFCLFNNIFIGARHAQEAHGMRKIAIVDFDVHHGNGTDALTRAGTDDIFFISSHQFPLWPMSGLPENNIDGKIMNLTLEGGAGSKQFRALYEAEVFPALDKFAPDLIMISAGFDAHKNDPLAGLNLTEEDYGWITENLRNIALKHCNGKIISVLEGGYDLNALKDSVSAHLRAISHL